LVGDIEMVGRFLLRVPFGTWLDPDSVGVFQGAQFGFPFLAPSSSANCGEVVPNHSVSRLNRTARGLNRAFGPRLCRKQACGRTKPKTGAKGKKKRARR